MFIKNYIAKLKGEFKGYNGQKFSKDLMAGITVAAVALPLALAFGTSSVGGTGGSSNPAAAGLITAIFAGLIIGALSGASFQISGPTGAMSAILMGIVATQGIQNVFVVSVLAGILILVCAIFKLGKFISMIPRPVITGFTSGIAIIIALGQVDNFLGTKSQGESALAKIGSYFTVQGNFSPQWQPIVIGLIVVLVMLIWPKKWNSKVPSSLVGIIVATLISLIPVFDGLSLVGEIPKTLILPERFSFKGIDFSKFGSYISPAISIAALGLIESLLCGASASKMKNEEFDANQELIAQGIGNVVIPFFGGIPATAAIARTSVAIKSGCVTRLTSIIHALVLLASMFLLGPVMAKIPLSALAGVLMVTAWRMNEWHSIKTIFKKKQYTAIAKFAITMIATVVFDLTVAIIIGIVFSIFVYLFSIRFKPQRLKIEDTVDENQVILTPKGALFFANTKKLEKAILDASRDNKRVILSVKNVCYIDTSAIELLTELKEQITLEITDADSKTIAVLTKFGLVEKKNYDVVLFDLDGTLTDPGQGITNSVEYALNKYGIAVENKKDLYKFIGPPLIDSFKEFYGFSEEKAIEAVAYYREYYVKQGINENKLYDGIEALLIALRSSGKKIALATSKPEEFAHRVLQSFNIDGYFDFIGGASMDEKTRSTKEQVLEYVLENVGAENSIIMIGDRHFDINGAKQFGLDSIGVLFGYGSKSELENAGATYLAKSPQQIAQILL